MTVASSAGPTGPNRKRSHESLSRYSSPVGKKQTRLATRTKARQNGHGSTKGEDVSEQVQATPRRQQKKVRFSDPGPRQDHQSAEDNLATGLTPSLMRTSFHESDTDEAPRPMPPSPTRKPRRRQSAPSLSVEVALDPVLSGNDPKLPRVVQFTPYKEVLDARTRRRLQRNGLGEEYHRIEKEKREAIKRDKARDAELAALKRELEAVKAMRSGPSVTDVSTSMSTHKIEELEAEIRRLKQQRQEFSRSGPVANATDDDTVMADRCAMAAEDAIASQYPVLSEAENSNAPQASVVDAAIQTSFRGYEPDDVAAELEAARQEKLKLFQEWRAHVSPSDGDSDSATPPPDFMEQIVPKLSATLRQATETCETLDNVHEALSSMGFPGANVQEAVQKLRQSFRETRLELERIFPGETTARLDDGSATLEILVRRLKQVANALLGERRRYSSLCDTEKALRRQFDNCLIRFESATQRIKQLEETIDSTAEDMLHARMKIQRLEAEAAESELGNERLRAALDKYRSDIKNLESIISTLETEKANDEKSYQQEISNLRVQVTAEGESRRAAENLVAEHEKTIDQLRQTIDAGRMHESELKEKIAQLEDELKTVEEEYQQRTEKEVGSVNARLAEVTTALETANMELDRLRRRNEGLEKQVELEIESRERMIDQIMGVMRAERRSAKVRHANWKLASDEIDTEPMLPGSEPFSPVRGSTKPFGQVRLGRGKDRKSLDSGIGILTEDDLESNNEDASALESDCQDKTTSTALDEEQGGLVRG